MLDDNKEKEESKKQEFSQDNNQNFSPKPVVAEVLAQEKQKTVNANPQKSKLDDEKAKRKQIELEMKKWEKEQVKLNCESS